MNTPTPTTNLKFLRKINDVTLDDVALATGLSVGYLNRYERGYIKFIKNDEKRIALDRFIKVLDKKSKSVINTLS